MPTSSRGSVPRTPRSTGRSAAATPCSCSATTTRPSTLLKNFQLSSRCSSRCRSQQHLGTLHRLPDVKHPHRRRTSSTLRHRRLLRLLGYPYSRAFARPRHRAPTRLIPETIFARFERVTERDPRRPPATTMQKPGRCDSRWQRSCQRCGAAEARLQTVFHHLLELNQEVRRRFDQARRRYRRRIGEDINGLGPLDVGHHLVTLDERDDMGGCFLPGPGKRASTRGDAHAFV